MATVRKKGTRVDKGGKKVSRPVKGREKRKPGDAVCVLDEIVLTEQFICCEDECCCM